MTSSLSADIANSANDETLAKAKAILNRMAVHPEEYPHVYYIGAKATRLTFVSQQQRALNLVWALEKVGQLKSGTEIAVVGGGLAGMTAFVAARRLGAKVTLFERKDDILHLQRGSRLRFVHPNIYDWPDSGAENPLTNLPCLNWGAGMADTIAETLLRQWRREKILPDECLYGQEVRHLRYLPDGRPIVCSVGAVHREIPFDFVLLSLGFGLEKDDKAVPFLSYWENDNFSRPAQYCSPPYFSSKKVTKRFRIDARKLKGDA